MINGSDKPTKVDVPPDAVNGKCGRCGASIKIASMGPFEKLRLNPDGTVHRDTCPMQIQQTRG